MSYTSTVERVVRAQHWIATALLAVILAGCGASSSPDSAATPTITALAVSPAGLEIAPSQSSSLTATATYSDARTADVSANVVWSSSSENTLQVDANGAVTAVTAGRVVVTATLPNGLSASTQVVVRAPPSGFTPVDASDWTETSVRKVLSVFAFGGHATDTQIRAWATMEPSAAIEQMLSFDYTNELLSPAEDATAQHANSLQALQSFWSASAGNNPMRWDKRRVYATLVTAADGTTYFVSPENLQRTWIQAIRTRGPNPFLHRVAFYLTNYQLAIKGSLGGTALTRSYYDEILHNLATRRPFTTTINDAAQSAAVATRYIHRNNLFFNNTGQFSGNDDFAREYFQLFFRLTGLTEDPAYHEGTSIFNNARLLTGMQVDRAPNAYGSTADHDWMLAPIRFSDHVDAQGRSVSNATLHHSACLDILRQSICGRTAAEKLAALSPIVAAHPEVLANLPVFIIEHFADDQLTDEKIAVIRAEWLAADDDLLAFLRQYAVSSEFHREDTVKFASTFTRNLTLSARTTLNNSEGFLAQDVDFPRSVMSAQDGTVFEPVHDVFGAQTGVEASLSSGIFKHAFDTAVATHTGSGVLIAEYATDASQSAYRRWEKDWRIATPPRNGGMHTVAGVAPWLWERLLNDGGKNFDAIAQSQVYALLATGLDFGAAVVQIDPSITSDPETIFSSDRLESDSRLSALVSGLGARSIDLDAADTAARLEANRRMNLAVSFISMMPYSFAIEGR